MAGLESKIKGTCSHQMSFAVFVIVISLKNNNKKQSLKEQQLISSFADRKNNLKSCEFSSKTAMLSQREQVRGHRNSPHTATGLYPKGWHMS